MRIHGSMPVAVVTALLSLGCATTASSTIGDRPFDIRSIEHVVVIYQENWSFDSLYSQFPGANGYAFGAAVPQTLIPQDAGPGSALMALPSPLDASGALDTANFPGWPAAAPVKFFDLGAGTGGLPASALTGDLVHQFYAQIGAIHGGKNDRFVAWSDNPGLVLSGYDATNLPEGRLARKYTMCDNAFHSTFGGSFLNHIFLVAAAAPVYGPTNAPILASALKGQPPVITMADPLPTPAISPGLAGATTSTAGPVPTTGNDWPAILNPDETPGRRAPDGKLTTGLVDGSFYAVNTMQPPYWPFSRSGPFLPPQTMPTIGDRLTAAGLSWKWYSGGWRTAVAGKPEPTFQYHHQAFNYFARYAPGTPGRTHLADVEDLVGDLATGSLPAVSFVKLVGASNEHPGYADLLTGQDAVADLVAKIQASPNWKSTAIFITYDEYGGRWDHVAPPVIDSWGPGGRVPFIVISPYARRGYVDHTQHETLSILRFIEKRWGLQPLGTRDANASDLTSAFTGTQRLD